MCACVKYFDHVVFMSTVPEIRGPLRPMVAWHVTSCSDESRKLKIPPCLHGS